MIPRAGSRRPCLRDFFFRKGSQQVPHRLGLRAEMNGLAIKQSKIRAELLNRPSAIVEIGLGVRHEKPDDKCCHQTDGAHRELNCFVGYLGKVTFGQFLAEQQPRQTRAKNTAESNEPRAGEHRATSEGRACKDRTICGSRYDVTQPVKRAASDARGTGFSLTGGPSRLVAIVV